MSFTEKNPIHTIHIDAPLGYRSRRIRCIMHDGTKQSFGTDPQGLSMFIRKLTERLGPHECVAFSQHEHTKPLGEDVEEESRRAKKPFRAPEMPQEKFVQEGVEQVEATPEEVKKTAAKKKKAAKKS